VEYVAQGATQQGHTEDSLSNASLAAVAWQVYEYCMGVGHKLGKSAVETVWDLQATPGEILHCCISLMYDASRRSAPTQNLANAKALCPRLVCLAVNACAQSIAVVDVHSVKPLPAPNSCTQARQIVMPSASPIGPLTPLRAWYSVVEHL